MCACVRYMTHNYYLRVLFPFMSMAKLLLTSFVHYLVFGIQETSGRRSYSHWEVLPKLYTGRDVYAYLTVGFDINTDAALYKYRQYGYLESTTSPTSLHRQICILWGFLGNWIEFVSVLSWRRHPFTCWGTCRNDSAYQGFKMIMTLKPFWCFHYHYKCHVQLPTFQLSLALLFILCLIEHIIAEHKEFFRRCDFAVWFSEWQLLGLKWLKEWINEPENLFIFAQFYLFLEKNVPFALGFYIFWYKKAKLPRILWLVAVKINVFFVIHHGIVYEYFPFVPFFPFLLSS